MPQSVACCGLQTAAVDWVSGQTLVRQYARAARGRASAAATSVSEATAHGLQERLYSIFSAPGLKGAIYGLIIILFVLFEPLGLYGRWLKIKLYFQLFPLYKKATFRRQKTYVKSERNR